VLDRREEKILGTKMGVITLSKLAKSKSEKDLLQSFIQEKQKEEKEDKAEETNKAEERDVIKRKRSSSSVNKKNI
jgi:hypothetical protein